MKKSTLGLIGTLVLVLAVAVFVVSPAFSKMPPATAAAGISAVSAAPAPVPPHPEIQRALDALQAARAHIHDAAHDFGGHRVEALAKIDEAIHQLQICMRYER